MYIGCAIAGINMNNLVAVAGNERIGLFSSPMLETVLDLRTAADFADFFEGLESAPSFASGASFFPRPKNRLVFFFSSFFFSSAVIFCWNVARMVERADSF